LPAIHCGIANEKRIRREAGGNEHYPRRFKKLRPCRGNCNERVRRSGQSFSESGCGGANLQGDEFGASGEPGADHLSLAGKGQRDSPDKLLRKRWIIRVAYRHGKGESLLDFGEDDVSNSRSRLNEQEACSHRRIKPLE